MRVRLPLPYKREHCPAPLRHVPLVPKKVIVKKGPKLEEK